MTERYSFVKHTLTHRARKREIDSKVGVCIHVREREGGRKQNMRKKTIVKHECA